MWFEVPPHQNRKDTCVSFVQRARLVKPFPTSSEGPLIHSVNINKPLAKEEKIPVCIRSKQHEE
jgi:hypothetical protein